MQKAKPSFPVPAVITLTKSLESVHFKVVASTQYRMSWGTATVHIQQRVAGVNLSAFVSTALSKTSSQQKGSRSNTQLMPHDEEVGHAATGKQEPEQAVVSPQQLLQVD